MRPVKGKYPVGSWKAGEIIRDEHTIRVPADLGHDNAEVYVGHVARRRRA